MRTKKFLGTFLSLAMVMSSVAVPIASADDTSGTKTLNLKNNECITNYHGTIGWDENENAAYMEADDSYVQYQIDASKYVPEGAKWYKTSFSLKKVTDYDFTQIGWLWTKPSGSLIHYIEENSSVTYVKTGGYATAYQKAIDWTSDYVKVDYYVNDENSATKVYVYIDNEPVATFTNPSETTNASYLTFRYAQPSGEETKAKAYIKDVEFSWSDENLRPAGEKVLDFKTQEYMDSANGVTIGYDSDLNLGYASAAEGVSNGQFKAMGQKFVPDGFEWYKVSYKMKKSNASVDIGFAGVLSESTNGDYSPWIAYIQDMTNNYSTTTVSSAGYAEAARYRNNWTNWTSIDYYVHDVDGTTTVYAYLDGDPWGEFTNSTATTTVGMLWFQFNGSQTVYFENISYAWSESDPRPEPEVGNETDERALKGGHYDFDVSQNVYIQDDSNIKQSASNGVLTISYPGTKGNGLAILLADNTPATPKQNWAKLTYDIKLSADNIRAVGEQVGMAYARKTDGSIDYNKKLVNAYWQQWGMTDSEGNSKYTIKYNAGAKDAAKWFIEDVDINMREWTHIEYFADLRGDTVQIYFRFNNGELYGPYDTTYSTEDIAGFGRLNFGEREDSGKGKLKLKNVTYSWGNEAADIEGIKYASLDSCTYSDGKVSYTYTPFNEYPCQFFVALYDEDKNLLGVNINESTGEFDVDGSGSYTLKVMMWKDGTVIPLREFYSAKVN